MDYEFEMHNLRRTVLQQLADGARSCEYELSTLRMELQRYIRRNCEPQEKSPTANEFGTIFENAVEIVTGNKEIDIEEMPAILNDHDGEIEPSEIDGESVEVVKSYSGNLLYNIRVVTVSVPARHTSSSVSILSPESSNATGGEHPRLILH